ncbi:hypothetical protein LPJ74_006767 [Coemansia sp. RSA 1843]|nr:hypothetical protein LPJ74_006767 [Coemansia sp. RSA 1843]
MLEIEKLEIEKLEIEMLEIEKLEIEKLEIEKLEIEKHQVSKGGWSEKARGTESRDQSGGGRQRMLCDSTLARWHAGTLACWHVANTANAAPPPSLPSAATALIVLCSRGWGPVGGLIQAD